MQSWFRLFAFFIAIYLVAWAPPSEASSLRISINSNAPTSTAVEADYTTSHVFVNEVAHERVPIAMFFDPQTTDIQTAEIFTNLNRRERATRDADGDGIEDGIKPPPGNTIVAGDDGNYYKAYTMKAVSGGYQLTLYAEKCGAYRMTARYRLKSDAVGTYRWYGDEQNNQAIHKRDHAIVISPDKARDMRIYEANPLTMLATGTKPEQRGTFADLAKGLPASQSPRFSLSYIKNLGCNVLWLQPIHPRGISGRQVDFTTNQPYDLGSPYAVKNFFAVMPLMAKTFAKGNSSTQDDTAAGRAEALKEFQEFVQAADAQQVDVMLDAPFSHTAQDAELSDFGQNYWRNGSSNPTSEIRTVEARLFSRANAYDLRAHDSLSVAIAPDRYDFNPSHPELSYGKWSDVFDIYFGRYAALVANVNQSGNYKNEGDWFDYSVGDENASGQGNGHFDTITQNVWRYFGDYLQFWLTQTGYPPNSDGESLNTRIGIDGLRADFAQGLPPQCWEYIVNRTRARKWNFFFMAESLDGGPVTYRSARHFDVLNENIIYELHHARTASDFRRIYDDRRNNYGDGLVLLNTSSQDEDNYKDPFEAFLRFAANSTIDGVPMIFPGQELGIRGTIIPPNDSVSSAGPAYGYERYESGFAGKPIPHFKTFNSLMPLWRDLAGNNTDAKRLYDLYGSIGQARSSSPALRSSNRVFLQLTNNALCDEILAVAKFERRNADPKESDVVFAFVNLTNATSARTPDKIGFNIDVDTDNDGMNDFGVQFNRLYNVKNIAAYIGSDPGRRAAWVWPKPRKGSDILKDGISVQLNRVPKAEGDWQSSPYEAQYLKLYDVTP